MQKTRSTQYTIRNTADESGQAVVLALLALALAVLLVTVFLYYGSTSQRATAATQEQTTDRYSADAGVEYAIWKLQNGSGAFNDTITINGQTVVITVTQVLPP